MRIAKKDGAPGRSATAAADCASASYDPQLGTLQLEPGFEVVDSAAVPEGVGEITAVPVGK